MPPGQAGRDGDAHLPHLRIVELRLVRPPLFASGLYVLGESPLGIGAVGQSRRDGVADGERCRPPEECQELAGVVGRRGWTADPEEGMRSAPDRSEEHTSELQSRGHLVCRLLLEKKKEKTYDNVLG